MRPHLRDTFRHLGIPIGAAGEGERHSAASGMYTSENGGRFRIHREDPAA